MQKTRPDHSMVDCPICLDKVEIWECATFGCRHHSGHLRCVIHNIMYNITYNINAIIESTEENMAALNVTEVTTDARCPVCRLGSACAPIAPHADQCVPVSDDDDDLSIFPNCWLSWMPTTMIPRDQMRVMMQSNDMPFICPGCDATIPICSWPIHITNCPGTSVNLKHKCPVCRELVDIFNRDGGIVSPAFSLYLHNRKHRTVCPRCRVSCTVEDADTCMNNMDRQRRGVPPHPINHQPVVGAAAAQVNNQPAVRAAAAQVNNQPAVRAAAAQVNNQPAVRAAAAPNARSVRRNHTINEYFAPRAAK